VIKKSLPVNIFNTNSINLLKPGLLLRKIQCRIYIMYHDNIYLKGKKFYQEKME